MVHSKYSWLAELGYEKVTVEKDHKPRTKYRHPDQKYHDLSLEFAEVLTTLINKETAKAELVGRIDELKRCRRLFSDNNDRGFRHWSKGRIERLEKNGESSW